MLNPLRTQVGGNHYKGFKIQPAYFATVNDLGFLQGCIVKRICRYDKDGGEGIKDLEKIKHEIDLLIYIKYSEETIETKEKLPDCSNACKDEPKMNVTPEEVYQNAVSHGWWDEGECNFGEIIANCHAELSEALEEARKGFLPGQIYFEELINPAKPEGIPIELADCIIRIYDYCGRYDIDIQEVILIKL
jgi:hypothetical protein